MIFYHDLKKKFNQNPQITRTANLHQYAFLAPMPQVYFCNVYDMDTTKTVSKTEPTITYIHLP